MITVLRVERRAIEMPTRETIIFKSKWLNFTVSSLLSHFDSALLLLRNVNNSGSHTKPGNKKNFKVNKIINPPLCHHTLKIRDQKKRKAEFTYITAGVKRTY